jgi:transcriptional regulator with XRE-family HTH domain
VQLGVAIRELREAAGLKQIEAATAVGATEIERGNNNPGWLLIVRIVNEGLAAN